METIIPGVVEVTLDGKFTALLLDSVISGVVEAALDGELKAWVVIVVVAGLDVVSPCVLVTLLAEDAGIAFNGVVVGAGSASIKSNI